MLQDAELTTSGHNSGISIDSSSSDQNFSVSISPVSRPASPLASQLSMAPSMVSPVKIPAHWRPDTLKCIKQKLLSSDSRNDIVRTLVSIMMSKVGAKPTRGQCEQVARDLILKYPFMKDDIGDGYVRLQKLHAFSTVHHEWLHFVLYMPACYLASYTCNFFNAAVLGGEDD